MPSPQLREFSQGRRLGKTGDDIVAGVHPHQQRGSLIDRCFVILQAGSIGCSDFNQFDLGSPHDVRDSKRTADFD